MSKPEGGKVEIKPSPDGTLQSRYQTAEGWSEWEDVPLAPPPERTFDALNSYKCGSGDVDLW